MEASPLQPPRRPVIHVLLDPEVIETHLQNGEPVAAYKAKTIWTMNKLIDEWDSDRGPGIVHGDDW